MKTTLLERKPAGLVLKEVRSVAPVGESEARAGCNCDRWGHACPGRDKRNIPTETDTTISSIVKQRGN